MKKNLTIIATVLVLFFFPKVIFGQVPVITVEPINQSVCVNSAVSFTVTATGAGLTYQWRKGTVNITNGGNISGADSPTLIVDPIGFPDVSSNYNVVVSGTYSPNAVSGNVTLTVNAHPSVTIDSGPTSVCSGDSTTLDAGIHSTYIWSTGATDETISVTASGFYVVTVSNDAGCTNSAHKTVSVHTSPMPNIFSSGLSNLCTGGTAILNVGATFDAYSWSNGETNQTIIINNGGTYVCTVTNSNGCTGTASQVATYTLSPSITTNVGATICAGHSVIMDVGTFTSCIWNTNETTQAITVSTTGTYSVTVTNSYGCTGTTEQLITVYALPTPTIVASGATTFCVGGSVTLDAGTGYYYYTWSNPSTTQTISVTGTGDYSVTCTNGFGCTGSAASATHVTVNPLPTVVVTGNLNSCPGGSTTLTATGCTNFSWSPATGLNTTSGATVVCHLPSSSPIIYTVVGTNNCGSSPLQITATTGLPTFTNTFTNCHCNGDSSASIAISGIGGSSPYSYTLTNTLNNTVTQSSNSTVQGLIATRYRVNVVDVGGCAAAVGFVTITQPSALAFSYSKTNESCNGTTNASITLSANSGTPGVSPNPRYYYTSNANASTPTFIGGASNSSSYTFSTMQMGTYYIRIKDANGCLSAVTNTVSITQPAALTYTAAVVASSCSSSTGQIILNTTGGTGNYNFTKNGGSTWQSAYTFTNLSPATYPVNAKDANGCMSTLRNVTVTCSGNRISDGEASGTTTFNVYPNPAQHKAVIEFQNTDANAHVVIEFYNITGDKLSTLFDSDVEPGVQYQAEVNLESLPSGIYFYRVISGESTINKKLIVLK